MKPPVINFGPGPAKIPQPVIEKIQFSLLNWQNTGLSILEVGHRSQAFKDLIEQMTASVRRILQVPEQFAILFLPAGAQNQFAVCPLNLLGSHQTVNYLETGYWSKKAINEAKRYAHVNVCASSAENHYCHIPRPDDWHIDEQGAFFHFTDNETIGGLEFPFTPDVENQFLVSDMSSNLFSRPIDFHNYGCIYACAQKNFGISGLTLVMVREDLLDRASDLTPSVFNYKKQWENQSSLATPPTFAFFVASLMFDWIEEQGGVEKLDLINKEKSALLYQAIDNSNLYHNPIEKQFRSRMNVPFILSDEQLTNDFLGKASNSGFVNLKGHRSVGGLRASIYNAISLDEVRTFVDFMEDYEKTHG